VGTIFLCKPEQAKMSRMQDVEVSGYETVRAFIGLQRRFRQVLCQMK